MRISVLILFSFILFSACQKAPLNSSANSSAAEPGKPYVWQPAQVEQNALTKFIASPEIDPKVEAFADLGYERYEKNSNNLEKNRVEARDLNQNGGGRNKHTWIKDTFDKEEHEIIAELKTIDAPPTFTIKEIDKLYADLVAQVPRGTDLKKAKFNFVTGVNVNYLHEAPLGKDAFVQLASQFNYLESPGTHKSTVLSYRSDETQGPMGSIEAAAAAIHRTAAEDAGKLKDALAQVLPHNKNEYYKNGYLELFKLSSDAEKAALRQHVESNIKELSILPHWVKNEASGVKQFQVFSAAPSYQGKSSPAADSEEGKLVSTLVASQFEALAKLAVIRNVLTNKPVAVHLARVGQGAFHNPPEALNDALKRVAEVVKGYPDVHVFMHGFGKNDTEANIKATDANLVNISNMDRQAFFSAKALDN